MNENSINPVTSVTSIKPEDVVNPAPIKQEQTPVVGVKQGMQKPQENQAKSSGADSAAKPELPISSMQDVSLRFRVDEKTKNITVYIIDRETKRVLRSIPPEELNKLQAGDLLHLTA